MANTLSVAGTLTRLRQARNQLLLSQDAVLDLSAISDTEAARLDLPENRAKRLADALGRPEMALDQATAIYSAAERLLGAHNERIGEKRRAKQDATPSAAEPVIAASDGASTAAEELAEPSRRENDPQREAIADLTAAITEVGLPPRDIVRVISVGAKIRAAKSRSGLMLESLLISAVAQFEVFISRMITASLRFDPSALEASEKKYLYGDIYKYESIESFTSAAADAYVDALMYDGMDSWMKFLARATRSDTSWVSDLLEEVVMRRNIHVHAGGRASPQYLSALGKKAAAVKVGDHLPVTAEYLNDALDRMARSVIVLTQAASAAVCSTAKGKAAIVEGKIDPDQLVVDASFDLLAAGRYAAVAPLSAQLEAFPVSASTRERIRANSFVAQKKSTGLESVRGDIAAWDVSASEDELVLAKHCLLEEIEEAKHLFKRLSDSDRITLTELATWPILEPLRLAMEQESAGEPGAGGALSESESEPK
jgi:hypothetical protein